MRTIKPILVLGAPLALLTAYIYSHASLDTFLVYLLALTLWAGLFGYCVHIREKQPRKASTVSRQQ